MFHISLALGAPLLKASSFSSVFFPFYFYSSSSSIWPFSPPPPPSTFFSSFFNFSSSLFSPPLFSVFLPPQDVLKRTPEDHPDYRNLKSALERMVLWMQQKTLAAVRPLCFPPFLQGELADYIDATVRESQTKKTLELLKNKVHGLSVRMLALFPVLTCCNY